MLKTILPVMAALLLISGCGLNSGRPGSAAEGESAPDTMPKVTDDSLIYPVDSGIVCVNLTDGKATLLIHKKKDSTVYLEFENNGYKKLSATLRSEDSLANIRFTQIVLPNGEMDGPFGRDITYDLPWDGRYKLLVGENLMAGFPWKGDFTAEITLSR